MRAAVGGAVLAEGAARVAVSAMEATPFGLVVTVLLFGCGLLLLAGLLTPVAGLLAGATLAVQLVFGWLAVAPAAAPGVGTGAAPAVDATGALVPAAAAAAASLPRLFTDAGTILVLIVTMAIVLLGPGALSLDAYLFGRREIVIPHDRNPQS